MNIDSLCPIYYWKHIEFLPQGVPKIQFSCSFNLKDLSLFPCISKLQFFTIICRRRARALSVQPKLWMGPIGPIQSFRRVRRGVSINTSANLQTELCFCYEQANSCLIHFCKRLDNDEITQTKRLRLPKQRRFWRKFCRWFWQRFWRRFCYEQANSCLIHFCKR